MADTTGLVADPNQNNNWIQQVAQIISGGINLATQHDPVTYGNQAAAMADPWASQRAQYQPQLNTYMQQNPVNPGSIAPYNVGGANARGSSAYDMLLQLLQNPASIRDNPAYRAGLDFGSEAVNRGAGSSGMLNSGNRLLALDQFGQNYGMNFYNQTVNQLLGNVGAANSVDAAGMQAQQIGNQTAQLGLNAQQQGYNELATLAGVNAGSPVNAAQAYLAGRQGQAQNIGAGTGSLVNGAVGLASNPAFLNMIRGLGGSGNIGPNGVELGGGLNSNTVYGPGSGWGEITPSGMSPPFNPDDWSSWLGQNSSISLGTSDNIFAGLMDAFG